MESELSVIQLNKKGQITLCIAIGLGRASPGELVLA